MKLVYRFTTKGEGVFSAGKRLLPEELVDEVLKAKAWLPKPPLGKGTFRFYLTKKGKEQYKATLYLSHNKYLPDIKEEASPYNSLKHIVYEDIWQVAVKVK